MFKQLPEGRIKEIKENNQMKETDKLKKVLLIKN